MQSIPDVSTWRRVLRLSDDLMMQSFTSLARTAIEPLTRQNGLIEVFRNSNGLLTITGMLFATMAGDQELMRKMSQI